MNPAIVAVGGSTIRALHARKSATAIDLGIGEPTLKPNVAHFEAATRWVAENGCRYSTNYGDEDLRAEIGTYYGYRGLDKPENVCVMTGSQEAVYVSMKALLDPAEDEVVVVEPAFPIYGKIAQIEGVAVKRVAMRAEDGFAFDPELILAALTPRTRMLVICSPCNPTGRVITKAAVKQISDALKARRGVPVYVLHDEIYRELLYTQDAGNFGDEYPHTIAVNSLSKSNALTGLRLGWVIAPSDVMPAIVKMHGWATSCASTFAQRVAHSVFVNRELKDQLPWYARQRAGVVRLAEQAGLRFVEPDGAFYLWVHIGLPDMLEFAHRLIDESDVVAIPGGIFASSAEGWLRTSFVGPLDRIAQGFERIAAAAERYLPNERGVSKV